MSNLFLRIFCPANCKTQPSYWSPVIGNNIYTDVSNTLFCVTQIVHESHQRSRSSSSVLFFFFFYVLLVQTESKGYLDLMTLQALWCMVVMESQWITVWIWLMENGGNGEVSQRLPGMYYPSWGLTTQRLIQALSQTKCLCLRGRRYRKKWFHADWFTSSLRIHLNHVQSRYVIVKCPPD